MKEAEWRNWEGYVLPLFFPLAHTMIYHNRLRRFCLFSSSLKTLFLGWVRLSLSVGHCRANAMGERRKGNREKEGLEGMLSRGRGRWEASACSFFLALGQIFTPSASLF